MPVFRAIETTLVLQVRRTVDVAMSSGDRVRCTGADGGVGGWVGRVVDRTGTSRSTASLVSSAMLLLATQQRSGNMMAPNPRIQF